MYGTPAEDGRGAQPLSAGPLASQRLHPERLRSQRLGPPHLEACLRLDRRSLGGLWSREQWATELHEPRRPGVGIGPGGTLVAMACGWLILEELHVTLVAVDPPWRRQGLGRRVLADLLAEGRGRGAERATLEVARGNAPARALYREAGFREAGCRRGYYRNGDDALIQWRQLRP
jgi:ribosomal-protein-alanine N-acetyltransferase